VNRILIAIDGSTHAWKALDQAMDYAKATNAEVIVLHVVPLDEVPEELRNFAAVENIEPGDAVAAWRKRTMLEDKIISEAKRRLRERNIHGCKAIILEGDPARTILVTAQDQDVDMIFIGHRGLSKWQWLALGSVAHSVVQLAHCTCVVVR